MEGKSGKSRLMNSSKVIYVQNVYKICKGYVRRFISAPCPNQFVKLFVLIECLMLFKYKDDITKQKTYINNEILPNFNEIERIYIILNYGCFY